MTRVLITKNGMHYRLHAVDHAGDKLVCAGISAVTYALAGALANVAEPDELRLEDGEVIIDCISNDNRVHDYYVMASIGLRQIELASPDKINVTVHFS